MKYVKTDRGFGLVTHPLYASEWTPAFYQPVEARLVQESSAVGDYEDSLDKPGSSFLWVGEHHHLNREEVRNFIDILQRWVETGRLGEI